MSNLLSVRRRRLRLAATTAALAAAFPAAPPALAGVTYHFANASTYRTLSPEVSGRVWADGGRYRVEYEVPAGAVEPYDVVVADGGRTLAVDSAHSTYFPLDRPPREAVVESEMFTLPVDGPFLVREQKIEMHEEPGDEEIDGLLPDRKYVLRLTYRVEPKKGEKVRAKVSATYLLWTTDHLSTTDLPVDPARLVTGLPAVDGALGKRLATTRGFPLKGQLSVTRVIEGGRPFTELVTLELAGLEPTELPGERTAVPADYREEAPQLAGPGGP